MPNETLGKLNSHELKEHVFRHLDTRRAEVLARAKLGGDCAAFSTNDVVLISTDPITGAVEDVGRLAMQVAFNDVSAAGGEPLLATITVLLPPSENLQTVSDLMRDAAAEAKRLNVEIVGGHTEFTDAVTRTVVSVTAIGTTKNFRPAAAIGAGDAIYLTRYAAIEGTRILATLPAIRAMLNAADCAEADALADSVGVAEDAALAYRCGAHALHDITEGGVLGALGEMLESAGAGATIDMNAIPVLPVTARVCAAAGANVYKLISSGALLIITSAPERLEAGFRASGRMLKRIGTVLPSAEGRKAVYPDRTEEITIDRDEIYRLMERYA